MFRSNWAPRKGNFEPKSGIGAAVIRPMTNIVRAWFDTGMHIHYPSPCDSRAPHAQKTKVHCGNHFRRDRPILIMRRPSYRCRTDLQKRAAESRPLPPSFLGRSIRVGANCFRLCGPSSPYGASARFPRRGQNDDVLIFPVISRGRQQPRIAIFTDRIAARIGHRATWFLFPTHHDA